MRIVVWLSFNLAGAYLWRAMWQRVQPPQQPGRRPLPLPLLRLASERAGVEPGGALGEAVFDGGLLT